MTLGKQSCMMAGMSITSQLKRAIEQAGVSRYVVCRRAQVDQGAVSRFMSGKRSLTLETADRLAEALGLELQKRRAT